MRVHLLVLMTADINRGKMLLNAYSIIAAEISVSAFAVSQISISILSPVGSRIFYVTTESSGTNT